MAFRPWSPIPRPVTPLHLCFPSWFPLALLLVWIIAVLSPLMAFLGPCSLVSTHPPGSELFPQASHRQHTCLKSCIGFFCSGNYKPQILLVVPLVIPAVTLCSKCSIPRWSTDVRGPPSSQFSFWVLLESLCSWDSVSQKYPRLGHSVMKTGPISGFVLRSISIMPDT